MSEGVSFVIPAYNEERGIKDVLLGLVQSVETLNLDLPWEIIVVNDGSDDRTGEEIREVESDKIRLITHEYNRGYGAALKTGIHNARHPWILITDADGTYPDSAVGEILEHRDQYQMVVGARTGAKAEVPLIRRPPKWVLRRLASYLARRDIPDLNSGLRLMRRDVVERYAHILPNGFSFTTTITLAMLSEGLRVKYVEIDYFKRKGTSKIRPIYDTLNFLQLIIRTIMYFEPLRVFIPMSMFFLVGSFAVGVGSYLWLDKLLDSTTVLLFVTGVQLLAIGMLADIVNKRLGRY